MTNRDELRKNYLPVTDMEQLNFQLANILLWYDEKYFGNIEGANEAVEQYFQDKNSLKE